MAGKSTRDLIKEQDYPRKKISVSIRTNFQLRRRKIRDLPNVGIDGICQRV